MVEHKRKRSVIDATNSEHVVFEYHPKEFPLSVTPEAQNFVTKEAESGTEFQISDLVSEQVGISELKKRKLEDKIEDLALNRLKEVEEKAYGESYKLGLIEGTEKAFQESKVEIAERMDRLEDMLKTFESIRSNLLAEHENQLIKLVYLVAKKMAFREVKEDQSVIVDVIKKVLEDIQIDDELVLRVSVEDFNFIESLKENIGKKFEDFESLKLEIDEGISSGGCVFESKYGVVDATLEKRVEKVWNSLMNKAPKIQSSEKSSPVELLSKETATVTTEDASAQDGAEGGENSQKIEKSQSQADRGDVIEETSGMISTDLTSTESDDQDDGES